MSLTSCFPTHAAFIFVMLSIPVFFLPLGNVISLLCSTWHSTHNTNSIHSCLQCLVAMTLSLINLPLYHCVYGRAGCLLCIIHWPILHDILSCFHSSVMTLVVSYLHHPCMLSHTSTFQVILADVMCVLGCILLALLSMLLAFVVNSLYTYLALFLVHCCYLAESSSFVWMEHVHAHVLLQLHKIF
jgi:hypothetical protein